MALNIDTGPISGRGTSEADWLPWLSTQLVTWPTLDLHDIPSPLVVAPHPDDEVLGAGGLLALSDRPVVIGLSDGEASHPHSRTVTAGALADIRRAERREALRRLREPDRQGCVQLVECHLPDGSLAERSDIADVLTSHLVRGRWCVAPWQHEGHPDHEAAGRAAATACRRTGARLLSYPVWSWHWAHPADPRLPWQRGIALPLSTEIQARKAAAIAAFTSQVNDFSDAPEDAAILPPAILDRFLRPYEVYFG